ncbi:hypothetical protein [Candidatus Liberibacter sp.]|uniref:hypothetical protein n=1 Tax=Candidatus Liberibacter sp. TaxID=34022 RepID=UPI0015F6AAEE|nr:hypothetical protein [Candidatus Liberibacter sp.]MBA5724464.1 hypothetical protein [Candidatus Liberibacter sp.]
MAYKLPASYTASSHTTSRLPHPAIGGSQYDPYGNFVKLGEVATKAIKTHADMMKSSAQLQSMKAVSDMSLETAREKQKLVETQSPDMEGFDKLEETSLQNFDKRAEEIGKRIPQGGKKHFEQSIASERAKYFNDVLSIKNKKFLEHGINQTHQAGENFSSVIFENPTNDTYKSSEKAIMDGIHGLSGVSTERKEKLIQGMRVKLADAQALGTAEVNPSAFTTWARKVGIAGKSGGSSSTSKKGQKVSDKTMTDLSVGGSSASQALNVPEIEVVHSVDNTSDTSSPPIEGWGHLSSEMKVRVLNKAFQKEASTKSLIGDKFRGLLSDMETQVNAGGNPRDIFNLESTDPHNVIHTLGERAGKEWLDKADELLTMGDFTDKIKGLPYKQALEYLQSQRPNTNDTKDLDKRLRIYAFQEKAFKNLQQTIADDPLKFAIETGKYGVRPLEKDIDTWAYTLKTRKIGMDRLQAEKGLRSYSLLSNDEAHYFKNEFQKQPALKAVDNLVEMGKSLGGVHSEAFKNTIRSLDMPYLPYVAEIASTQATFKDVGWFWDSEYPSGKVATSMLRGARIRSDTKKAYTLQTSNTFDAELRKHIHFSDVPDEEEKSRVFSSFREGILNYMAGTDVNGYKENTDNPSKIAEAFKIISGGGYATYRGSQVLPPWGMDRSSFRLEMNKRLEQVYPLANRFNMMDSIQTETIGNGVYRLKSGFHYLHDANDDPILIDLAEPMPEAKKGGRPNVS